MTYHPGWAAKSFAARRTGSRIPRSRSFTVGHVQRFGRCDCGISAGVSNNQKPLCFQCCHHKNHEWRKWPREGIKQIQYVTGTAVRTKVISEARSLIQISTIRE